MGLLEYLAMPYLSNVAHDGWVCTVYNYYLTAVGNSVSSQMGSTQKLFNGKYQFGYQKTQNFMLISN
jgi:hypothetical protein